MSTLAELLLDLDNAKKAILLQQNTPCTCSCDPMKTIYLSLSDPNSVTLTSEEITQLIATVNVKCQKCVDMCDAKSIFQTLRNDVNTAIQTENNTETNFLLI